MDQEKVKLRADLTALGKEISETTAALRQATEATVNLAARVAVLEQAAKAAAEAAAKAASEAAAEAAEAAAEAAAKAAKRLFAPKAKPQ